MRVEICAVWVATASLVAAAPASGQVGRPAEAPDAVFVDGQERENPYDYFGGLEYDDEIPSPAGVLGRRVGEEFSRHHEVLRYLRRLARASDRVRIDSYGTTWEGRELVLLTISSPANLSRLDEILERNRALADPDTSDVQADAIIDNNPAIAWLSYNVHGNEPSGSECAMQVAWTLAAATNPEIERILDNVVVVIDPMLNPDGRDRYVNWYRMTRGTAPNPDPQAAEHDEPWPGGRTNHYLFDLNRDWLWLVHPESRARIAAYREVLPQLHVDYHEQGYRNPYFFGAGDDPYNTNIPAETREWVERYGQANAEAFDPDGLLFSTKERFDYLYPGYGKVLPVYHGAVGMLTEKGGHSRAGLAIEVTENHTLTLTERVRHHFLTSMSNIEATADWREGQLERFRRFFVEAARAEEEGLQTVVISAANDPQLLAKVWLLCESHGIRVHRIADDATIENLRSYRDGEEVDEVELGAGAWVINAAQPMGRLVRVLFERQTEVTHIETYDITGWSLPISFGLEAWYSDEPLEVEAAPLEEWRAPEGELTGDDEGEVVALIVDSAHFRFPQVLGLLGAHELDARIAGEAFEVDGRAFSPGSLIVHLVHNEAKSLRRFARAARRLGADVHRASTGMTEGGPVLGANANREATRPNVLLVRGEGTSSYSFGQHWHLLDAEMQIPHTNIDADAIGGVELDEYTVVLLPEGGGRIAREMGDAGVAALKEWTRQGGTVVATGSSAYWASRALLDLTTDDDDGPDADPYAEDDEGEPEDLNEMTYEQRRHLANERRVPGAMVAIHVDLSHPLAAGSRDWHGVVKRNARFLPLAKTGYAVARYAEEPYIGGAMSDENKDRIAGKPWMTQHRVGRGRVICIADDVTMRHFQHGSMRLLLNAIVLATRP